MRRVSFLSGLKLLFSFLFFAASAGAFAGGTQADYQRAAELRSRLAGKVYRDQIEPNWFADGSMFWYRRQTGPNTHEFVTVDLNNPQRQPAFDHQRLAAALTEQGVKDAAADRLALERLEFNLTDNTLRFQTDGKIWQCRLDTYALQIVSEAPEDSLTPMRPEQASAASTRTGSQTYIIFLNQTEGEVSLFWLDSEGQRQPYGTLAAGQQRRQNTYEGHVWLIVGSDGSPIAVYQAQGRPGRAVIGMEPAFRRGRRTDGTAQRPQRIRPPRAVSPDGNLEAFIKDYNVWLRRLDSDQEVQLSRDGTADNFYMDRFYWSADSAKFVAVRRKPAQEHKVYFVESSPRDQLQPKLHSIDYLKPGDQVDVDKPCLFNAQNEKQIPVSDDLFANPWSVSDIRWMPDSSRFTFLYNQRGHQVLRIVAVDAASGTAEPLIDEKSDTFICYSSKYFCRFLDESNEIIWMSERDGWNHLYLYDANSGQVKNQITKGPWVVRDVIEVDTQKRQIWLRAGGIYPQQDPYYIHYVRVNFDGSGLTILTEGDGTHSVKFSPDKRYLIDTWSRVNQPPVHELRRSEDGKLLCELDRADISDLLKAGWQMPEPFVAKGRDGQTDIYGIIIRPTVFDPRLSYPVIENIYAGPQDSFVPKAFSPFLRMMEMAELGFILVQIDGMGTSNRSKAFHDVCWKNLSDAGFPDRILWIKAAAQKYPYMNISRVGIYGGSAGGQNAAAAVMKHGDFYKAAVADCGCHDNRMDKIWWNEQWMGWPVGPEYEANSNVTLAKNMQGKLMLIVGEMDQNVDPASTMQVVNALIKADKDFELLVVPGAGHGAGEGRYPSRRRADFFVRHLLGVEPRS
ncbi:MAG TPA: prolyl oligopeptidase family serine peptidase [Anaerohalosphaeraceae bacterium]|nr:prolyl oligopeptidase family serine peptidase [Anaerohalosphaeraceae bacterium]HOM75931.1 prolyl oligopeptidase family serine peptidase [Anaerohalosphaeraceae bacterium]HPC65057.1 prolyl oligopeptidase family serine peptidase [Anaerohalosphaeraceae bacterium]HRS72086.1 prolyl oligopeptidase family serine peptidase [Anaerohalosphaeraceae bacterium]HRV19241.1 prolyl oligopeptidase family serine peptidase [Anaerohalosphaeraceae bacterium]